MGQLREAAYLEKDATTCVQTRLLKQVDILRKSQSPELVNKKLGLPRCHNMTGKPHIHTNNLKRNMLETHDDDKSSENTEHPRSPKFPRIEDIVNIVKKRLNQVSQQSSKGMEHSGLRSSTHHWRGKSPHFDSQRNLWIPPSIATRELPTSFISASSKTKWRSTFMMTFSFVMYSFSVSRRRLPLVLLTTEEFPSEFR